MFVNTEGEPTRPTIEFDRYPRQIVVDGGSLDLSSRLSLSPEEEGFILASTSKELKDGIHYGLEIQRWDDDAAENEHTKYWLEPNQDNTIKIKVPQSLGVRSLLGADDTCSQEIIDRLCRRRFTPFQSGNVEASSVSLKSVDSRTALSMERMSREKELFDRDNDSQDDESLPEGWQATRNIEEEEFARRLARTTARLAVLVRSLYLVG